MMKPIDKMSTDDLRKRRKHYFLSSVISAILLLLCLYESYSSFMGGKSEEAFMFGFLVIFFVVGLTAGLILSRLDELAIQQRISNTQPKDSGE